MEWTERKVWSVKRVECQVRSVECIEYTSRYAMFNVSVESVEWGGVGHVYTVANCDQGFSSCHIEQNGTKGQGNMAPSEAVPMHKVANYTTVYQIFRLPRPGTAMSKKTRAKRRVYKMLHQPRNGDMCPRGCTCHDNRKNKMELCSKSISKPRNKTVHVAPHETLAQLSLLPSSKPAPQIIAQPLLKPSKVRGLQLSS